MAASNSIRLRRTLRAISSLHRSFSSSAATSAPPISLAIRRVLPSAPPAPAPAPWLSRSFRSSSISLWSNISSSASNIPDEMTPTIYCSRAATATTGSSAWTSPETTNPPPKKWSRHQCGGGKAENLRLRYHYLLHWLSSCYV
ncbi:uncharacterized protein LOC107645200 isoform X3 [Arachis ipaensis]|uniref:uncharacterized protein n=1 Tax=Arachis hypogaea TaxID=3818 RepID=UPI000A2B4CBA|nr:uncharacterized protein LOC107645200 isoform X2 [Arachis ipaensis]XP_020959349.1 uncharacterized protein LOC107645200 isoform X3 [Arachis ipaensis]XP_025657858.1 uncharacterized protein LOC112754427 isoform X1 [Arachis hypogaea]